MHICKFEIDNKIMFNSLFLLTIYCINLLIAYYILMYCFYIQRMENGMFYKILFDFDKIKIFFMPALSYFLLIFDNGFRFKAILLTIILIFILMFSCYKFIVKSEYYYVIGIEFCLLIGIFCSGFILALSGL